MIFVPALVSFCVGLCVHQRHTTSRPPQSCRWLNTTGVPAGYRWVSPGPELEPNGLLGTPDFFQIWAGVGAPLAPWRQQSPFFGLFGTLIDLFPPLPFSFFFILRPHQGQALYGSVRCASSVTQPGHTTSV